MNVELTRYQNYLHSLTGMNDEAFIEAAEDILVVARLETIFDREEYAQALHTVEDYIGYFETSADLSDTPLDFYGLYDYDGLTDEEVEYRPLPPLPFLQHECGLCGKAFMDCDCIVF